MLTTKAVRKAVECNIKLVCQTYLTMTLTFKDSDLPSSLGSLCSGHDEYMVIFGLPILSNIICEC